MSLRWLDTLKQPPPDTWFENTVFKQTPLNKVPVLRKIPLGGWCLVGVVIVALFIYANWSAGPEAQTPDTALASTPLSTVGLISSVMWKLGLVIGLIYVSIALLRRWRKLPARAADRRMTVLETTRLSQRQALHLIQVDQQVLLIGATDQTLTMLTELRSLQSLSAPKDEAPQPGEPLEESLPLSFASLFTSKVVEAKIQK